MSRPAMTRRLGTGDLPEERATREPTALTVELGRRADQAVRPQLPVRTRLALRVRALRRGSWWWKLGVPMAVVLLAAGAWFVWSGPVLVLRQVTVRGVPAADVAEMRTAAHLPVGRPMVRLDLEAARQRVAALRTVRDVTVSRSWPTSVIVAVTLRTPVAVVEDAAGRLHLADATGTSYAEVASAPRDLPLVVAEATDPAAVQSVVRVLAALPPGLRAQVTAAQAKSADAVVLTLGRLTVLWGGPDESALKASVLQALRRSEPGARSVDLSAPRAPSVR